MKKLILLILLFAMAAANAIAARMYPAGGRVVDEQGQAVEYATVVLLRGGEQVAGMATDDAGRFELKVPTGEYTLSIQYLGFDPVLRQVRVEADNDLGDIVLKSSSTQIEGVVVKAQLIRREADRFIVDVANAPAIGKDGIELLERAPGVWVDDEKISINGKSGSKVYVNDRELRMEPAQLLTYLRSLRADDIQKIEVVPTTGADYDADSSGGIIRITLRKRRENGVEVDDKVKDIFTHYRKTHNDGVFGQSPCARQLPFGTARPLRAGVVQPRNRRIRIGRKHPLHVGQQQSRSPLRKIRTRPEFRRELRFGVRDQFPPERRRGVRILAQARKRPQRLLHRFHGRRGRDPHRQPL